MPSIICSQLGEFPGFCFGPKTLFNETELTKQAVDLKTQYDHTVTTINELTTQFNQDSADFTLCTQEVNARKTTTNDLAAQIKTALALQSQLEQQLQQLTNDLQNVLALNKSITDKNQSLILQTADTQSVISKS
jgi:hypothetical protein